MQLIKHETISTRVYSQGGLLGTVTEIGCAVTIVISDELDYEYVADRFVHKLTDTELKAYLEEAFAHALDTQPPTKYGHEPYSMKGKVKNIPWFA